jgi:hypothetical protein
MILHHGVRPDNPSDEFVPGFRVSQLIDLSAHAFAKKMYPIFLQRYQRGFG